MSIDVRDGTRDTTGKLLHLPVRTAAGEAAVLRAELVTTLRERRSTVVEEMVDALHRAGLATVLQVGETHVGDRLDDAVGIMLAAWEHRRPLHAVELDALAALGAEVAAAGIPLWRLLSAVNQASRAGWQYVLEHAVALADGGRRPGTTSQLIGDLSVELFELVGRIEAQLAAGYGDSHTSSGLPSRLAVTGVGRRPRPRPRS